MTPLLAALIPSLLLAAPPLPWLARVNDQAITGYDLQEGFVRRHGGHKKFLAGETEARKFLEILVDYELLMQEAARLGLDEQPDIKKAVDEYRDRKMVDAILKAEVEDKAQPTPEAIKEFWDKNTSQVFTVRQIVVESPEKAAEIRTLALGVGDFEKLAREHSIVQSRLYGGQMALGRGSMDPAWEDTVFALKPGEISPVIKTSTGWEVVKLEQVKEVDRPKFEEAKARIEGILRKRLLDQRKHDFGAMLWAKYHASLTDTQRDLHALAKAAKDTPDLKLATWNGGALTIQELWPQLDMSELGGLPQFKLQEEIDARVRATVNSPLALLEAKARHMETVESVAEPTRRYQDDLMESALYKDYVLKDVRVSDEDVKAYYEQHKAELMAPEKRKMAHIVTASMAEAEDFRKKIDAGEPFEELAKKSTDTQSASKGGDLGFITARDVPPEFAAVLKLQEGEVTSPIQSKYGYHLMKVTKIVPAQQMTLEEAKADLGKRLLEQKQRDARMVWVKQLRAAATIKFNDKNIHAFVVESQKDADAKPIGPSHGQGAQPPGH